MLSCKDDVEAYNLLGWISGRTDNRFKTIYREAFAEGGQRSFGAAKKNLRKIVKKSFYDWEINLNDIAGMRYGMEYLVDLLLLGNAIDASRMGVRLPFAVINGNRHYLSSEGVDKEWKWHVEHISPQTPSTIDESVKKHWVESAESELGVKLEGAIDERFNKLMESYLDKRLKDLDSISNLVLLDSATNESYGNNVFAVKRKKILEVNEEFRKNDRTGRPILPMTYKAFSKSFNVNASQMRFWSQEDAESYIVKIQNLFSDFVKEN